MATSEKPDRRTTPWNMNMVENRPFAKDCHAYGYVSNANFVSYTPSYEERSAGDGCDGPPDLCQVWSVKLDGVQLRSSRMGRRHRQGPGLPPAGLAESGDNRRNDSSLLLEDELSARSLTVEVGRGWSWGWPSALKTPSEVLVSPC